MTAPSIPLVSIIMPVRNEEAFIARCLTAILNQDYPLDRLEIIVADGMSTDSTITTIRNLPRSERIRVIANPKGIQTAGMNEAIRQSHGDIIMRVDGHTILAPDYVRRCIEVLQQTGAQNVGGPMDPAGVTPLGKAIAAAGKSAFAVPSAFHVSEKAQYTDTVYLGAWPRQIFDQVGLFNEELDVNNDYELNHRIARVGGKIFLSPLIRSQYYGRQTLSALARQYFRYGRAKIKMLRQFPQSVRPRQLAAPTFVAALIGGGVLSPIATSIRRLWLIMLAVYTALNLFFSFRVAMRSSWAHLWRLPLVFLTIHVAWGAGFLIGLLRSDRAKPFDAA